MAACSLRPSSGPTEKRLPSLRCSGRGRPGGPAAVASRRPGYPEAGVIIAAPAMNKTDLVDRSYLRDDLPEFRPGDTVKVHVRVVEGNRERIQVFQGVVIRRQGGG